jgi:membrane protein implicated in regulation of membrane protease activity
MGGGGNVSGMRDLIEGATCLVIIFALIGWWAPAVVIAVLAVVVVWVGRWWKQRKQKPVTTDG